MPKRSSSLFKLGLLSAAMAGSVAQAQSSITCDALFAAVVTAGDTTEQVCASSLQSLYETGIRDLTALFPSYNGFDAVTTQARLNGLPVTASYLAGSPSLQFSIPELGVQETFAGATRVDSARMLHDWLKNNGDLLGRILKFQAKNSPLNPISGPAGVLTRSVATDFDLSFNDTATHIASNEGSARGAAGSLVGIGMVISRYEIAGVTVKTLSVPLSYTVRNDIDPRRQALLRGEVGVIDSGGTRIYNGRASAGYRFPMSDEWVLTPMAGVSLSGSDAAAFYTGVVNGSLASTYTFENSGFDITVGNLLGYYRTFKPGGSGTAMNPGIGEFALRNGILLSQPVVLWGSKMSAEYGFTDTRFLGGSLYHRDGQGLSFSLGTNKSAFSARSFFRATLLIERARDAHGVSLNVNYWF